MPNYLKFKKEFFIYISVFLLILTISILIFFFLRNQKIIITTTEQEYINGQDLKLEIKNSFLDREYCFSSCYPYFLERENGTWQPYSYIECPFSDEVSGCIEPGELSAFLVSLPLVNVGKHRISVPVCEDCSLGQSFHETGRIFSNEFEIK